MVLFVFKADIIGGELQVPEDEILQAKWFTFEEINNMKGQLRQNYILKAIERYKKGLSYPQDIIDIEKS